MIPLLSPYHCREVTPFYWTGLVNIVGRMRVHRQVVHIGLPVLYRTHAQTQLDTVVVVIPDLLRQTFQKGLLVVKSVHIIKLVLQQPEKVLHDRVVQAVALP